MAKTNPESELAAVRSFYAQLLFHECLPFWLNHGQDREHGGFITALDRDGSVLDTDKSVWHQGRFTWLLAELHNDRSMITAASAGSAEKINQGTLSHGAETADGHACGEVWLEAAIRGGEFMLEHCFDERDGRMWFLVDRQGRPLRKRRYAYTESFAAIAFGELAQATGKEKYRRRAVECFNRFLTHPAGENVEPKFTDVRKMIAIGEPMITIGTAQQLRDSIALESANSFIDEAVERIKNYFVKPVRQCVMEQVSASGEIVDHFDGRTLNPGHAIETAWFIMEEGRIRCDPQLVELGCNMFNWMMDRGWDPEHGGLLYFVDIDGKPVQEYWHDMKFWWPHNEAIIAALLAYELTGEIGYLHRFQRIHDWSFSHFHDQQYGEWYGYLHRDGSVSVPLKGNHWKGPFHYPRMLLMGIRIIDRMLADRDRP